MKVNSSYILVVVVVVVLLASIASVRSQTGGFWEIGHLIGSLGNDDVGTPCSVGQAPCPRPLFCFKGTCQRAGKIWRNNGHKQQDGTELRNTLFGSKKSCKGRKRGAGCFCKKSKNCKSGKCIRNRRTCQ